MDLLQNLLGGGQQRQEFQDFVQRYQQGPPYQGISDQEALQRYHQVAPQLPPNVYQDAARDAFEQMTPQERVEFGRYLQQRTRQQNVNFPDVNQDGIDDRFQDPGFLAQITGRMHQQQPGLLEQLLGGGMQQMMGGSSRQQAQSGGGMLDNPLAKAALAGIAAMAVRRMMEGGQRGPTGGTQGGSNPFGGFKM